MLAICESAVGLIIAGTKMRRTKFLLVVHRIYMKTVRTQFSGIELWENGSQCWRHTWRTLVRDCWTSVKQAGWQLEVRTHTSNLSTQNPKWCCTEPGGLCAEVFWQLWDNASAQHGPLSTCIMFLENLWWCDIICRLDDLPDAQPTDQITEGTITLLVLFRLFMLMVVISCKQSPRVRWETSQDRA